MDPWYVLVAVGVGLIVVGLFAVLKIKGSEEHSFKLAGVVEIASTGTGVFLVALGTAACIYGLSQVSNTDVRVTNVSLTTDTGHDRAQYNVKCPINVLLTGSISVSGDPGTVSYRLDRQDGLNGQIQEGSVETLAFDEPGTKNMRFNVPITFPEGQSYFESTLVVIDPTAAESGPVGVNVICNPDLPDGPTSPPPVVEAPLPGGEE